MLRLIASMQESTGGFSVSSVERGEDARFMYSACMVSELLGDWSGIDITEALRWLGQAQSMEGGYSLLGGGPVGGEAHGGSTYCAVAASRLLQLQLARQGVQSSPDMAVSAQPADSRGGCPAVVRRAGRAVGRCLARRLAHRRERHPPEEPGASAPAVP